MVQYLDFDLEILEKGKGYEAHVIYSPAGEARAPFTPPFDRKDLDLLRASIEKAVLRRIAAKAARRLPTPEVAQVREFGEKLFTRLMGNGVRDCYSRSCHEAQKQGCGLRLKLRLPAALNQVPWEFLYSRSDGDFLNLSIYRPIVRYLELPHMPVESLCVPAPLRILAVIASPKSQRLDPLDVAREKRVLQEALAALVQRGLIALDFLEGPDTFRQLNRRLRKEAYHVLHFIGHGGYDEEAQEGVLVMENEQRGEALVGSENLGRLLRDVRGARLVFLNACQGAVTSEADPFSSVAGALVRAGVPAVVAMQFEITDAAAILLAQEFYTALADNLPVDAALAEARKQIAFEDPDSLEWATPVLFMRVADGRLFEVTTEARPDVATVPVPISEKPVPVQPTTPPVTPPPSVPRPELDKLYTEALIAYYLGKWAEAVAGFQAVVDAQPDYEDAADRLSQTRQQWQLAEQTAREQAQRQEQKLADIYNQGRKALDDRKWVEAAACFRQVVAVDPGYRQAAQLLALAEAQAFPSRLIRPVDGQEMVLIPAGEFLMGSTDEEVARWNKESNTTWYDNEKPQRKVSLGAYYMDRTPITNAQYARFVEAKGYNTERFWTPDGWAWRQGKYKYKEGRKVEERKQPYFWKDSRWNTPGHPVVGINWFEAMVYCQWLNEQLHVPGSTFQVQRDGRKEVWNVELEAWNIRLPTEAEWEKAARGADGRRWPWGNEFDPQRCNSSEGGKGTTTPVGAYSPAGDSPYGVADMAGNVWEWCRSIYKPYPYQADDGREDLQAAGTRVLRGGSWDGYQRFARCAARYWYAPDAFIAAMSVFVWCSPPTRFWVLIFCGSGGCGGLTAPHVVGRRQAAGDPRFWPADVI